MSDRTLLDTLTFSKRRRKILLYLLDGPKTIDEIKEHLDCSSSPAMVQIKILLNKKIIIETDGLYKLSNIGLLLVPELKKTIMLFETLNAPDNYWAKVDLKSIPPHMLERLGEIGKTSLYKPKRAYIFECSEEMIHDLKDSGFLIEISSIFKNVYIREYIRMAEEGMPISLIFTKEVSDRLETEYPQIFYRFLRMDNVRFFTSKKIEFASCTITDNFLSLSLFTKDGHFYNHNLTGYSKNAREWGKDLFMYYRSISIVRTP